MKVRTMSLVVVFITLTINNTFAVYYWDPDSARAPLIGSWCDTDNWKATNSTDPGTAGNAPQFQPANGDQEIQMGSCPTPGAVIIVDCNITFSVWYSNRVRIFGGTQLNLVPGGTLAGIGWLRIGEGSCPNEGFTSAVIQTGGLMAFENGVRPDYKDPAGLTISDGGSGSDCDGLYHISGGTLTYLHPEATDGGHLRIGDRGGVGTFRVTGTEPVINMGKLEMGGRYGKTDLSRVADGTLMFDIVHDGVSPIVIDDYVNIHTYAPSTTHLVVNLTEPLDDYYDIVLVHNKGPGLVEGRFDNFNGGPAYDGVYCDIGMGIIRMLAYQYDADGDGANNDIVLAHYYGQEPPAAPTGLVASTGYTIVELDWDDNSDPNLDGYNIYRSETSGSGYTKLNTDLLTSSDYNDSSILLGETYYYVVTAFYMNESFYSDEVSSGPYGEFSGDGDVDMEDLPDFLDLWLDIGSHIAVIADVDGDNIVSGPEFTVFADNWRE
ncbi:MAG: fibronectin type III domain-containing protein [Sedimentisphaerales bacterium]|nr:fibronectin type III domain-containing protein [Sedimentisphaerales bacterium]